MKQQATRLDANCIPVLVLVSTNTNTPLYSVTTRIRMYCIPVLVLVSTNTNAPLYNVTTSIKERGIKLKEEFKRTNT